IVVSPSLSRLSQLEVKRDRSVIGPGLYNTPLPVDPGKHVISVVALGKKPWSKEITTNATDSITTTLPDALEDAPMPASQPGTHAAPATPGTPTPTPDTTAGNGQRTAGLVVAGVGVVGVGLAVGLGLHAKSKLDESNADGHCAGNRCDPAGTD